jgi:hypothetical protein
LYGIPACNEFFTKHKKKNFFPRAQCEYLAAAATATATALTSLRSLAIEEECKITVQHNFIHMQQSATCFGYIRPSSG